MFSLFSKRTPKKLQKTTKTSQKLQKTPENSKKNSKKKKPTSISKKRGYFFTMTLNTDYSRSEYLLFSLMCFSLSLKNKLQKKKKNYTKIFYALPC